MVTQSSSAERGSLVTIVGIINASGSYIPPVYVFPRVRYTERFLTGCMVGSIGINSKSGWMTSEIFPKVLHHIVEHKNYTPEYSFSWTLDNHCSHCSLEVITYCRDNGIILLTFPPHTSHRLQPLDVSIVGPFKKYCKTAFNDFLVSNPGKGITIYDVANLTKTPFLKAFVPKNIQSGFKATGIFPLNRLVFNTDDYVALD